MKNIHTQNKKRPKLEIQKSHISSESYQGFEIISFRNKDTGALLPKRENHYYYWKGVFDTTMQDDGLLQSRLNDSRMEIYEVKRISDGVKFKKGDRIVWDWDGSEPYEAIHSFEIHEGQLHLDWRYSVNIGLLNTLRLRHYENIS